MKWDLRQKQRRLVSRKGKIEWCRHTEKSRNRDHVASERGRN